MNWSSFIITVNPLNGIVTTLRVRPDEIPRSFAMWNVRRRVFFFSSSLEHATSVIATNAIRRIFRVFFISFI